jgi:hypothetical protein
MPCTEGKARRLLKRGKAKVVSVDPFTIRLVECYGTACQEVTLGIDSGYQEIGFSAITEKYEVLCGELQMLQDMSERMKERRMYRRQRRKALRYRKPRFANRKKQKGLLAPSIEHKYQTHIELVQYIRSKLPISHIVVEVAAFDIQKLKNPQIEGVEYQNGEQKGFSNLREYILHRDEHQCCNPECKNPAQKKILQVHHIGYWKKDRTDRPDNLITLCNKCHKPKNHQKKGFLYGWEPKVKSFREATFMSTVRWKVTDTLAANVSYGYITKERRRQLQLEKSHVNDAFVTAGGTKQKRSRPLLLSQIRRNHRSLQKFYDAKYVDSRTGEKTAGKELHSGRTCRNKNKNDENLRKYRKQKLAKGQVRIRKQRYSYQPDDLVRYNGRKHRVKGIQNYGNYIKLEGLAQPVKTSLTTPYLMRKGICPVLGQTKDRGISTKTSQ